MFQSTLQRARRTAPTSRGHPPATASSSRPRSARYSAFSWTWGLAFRAMPPPATDCQRTVHHQHVHYTTSKRNVKRIPSRGGVTAPAVGPIKGVRDGEESPLFYTDPHASANLTTYAPHPLRPTPSPSPLSPTIYRHHNSLPKVLTPPSTSLSEHLSIILVANGVVLSTLAFLVSLPKVLSVREKPP